MEENKISVLKSKTYYVKVYKSEKERKSLLVPPEYHKLLKLEAMNKGKTMREILIEAIKSYLKI